MASRMATSLGMGTSMPFDLQERLCKVACDGPVEKTLALVKEGADINRNDAFTA